MDEPNYLFDDARFSYIDEPSIELINSYDMRLANKAELRKSNILIRYCLFPPAMIIP